MQTGCILTWIYGGLLVSDRLAPPAGLIDWSIDTILQLIAWPQTVRWCQIFPLLADVSEMVRQFLRELRLRNFKNAFKYAFSDVVAHYLSVCREPVGTGRFHSN